MPTRTQLLLPCGAWRARPRLAHKLGTPPSLSQPATGSQASPSCGIVTVRHVFHTTRKHHFYHNKPPATALHATPFCTRGLGWDAQPAAAAACSWPPPARAPFATGSIAGRTRLLGTHHRPGGGLGRRGRVGGGAWSRAAAADPLLPLLPLPVPLVLAPLLVQGSVRPTAVQCDRFNHRLRRERRLRRRRCQAHDHALPAGRGRDAPSLFAQCSGRCIGF